VDPIVEFLDAADRARAHQVDTERVALATVDRDGRPSLRMVLIRRIDHRGFVFFTNYTSRKAQALTAHPHAALCFDWAGVDQQIRVEGPVDRTTEAESDEYFATRPRGGQLSAWASRQSAPLPSSDILHARVREADERFQDRAVERPPFWGGFRLVPSRIEFWHARTDRLHDRVVYTRTAGEWIKERLYP
jgi:pyridoxamine 5'-phosphate oxidase